MSDLMGSNATVAKLQAAIAFTARRHEVIANNIANVETPNYRAKDLSEVSFMQALETENVAAVRSLKVVDSPDAGAIRDDGNNVSIEAEVSKLSENAMRHNILMSLLKKQFGQLEAVLRGRVG